MWLFFTISYFREGYSQFEESTSQVIVKPLKGSYFNPDCSSVIADIVTHIKITVKPVLSGHSKIDKTKVLKTNGSLMKVESIAECSLGAFCYTFYLQYAIISLQNQFWSSF